MTYDINLEIDLDVIQFERMAQSALIAMQGNISKLLILAKSHPDFTETLTNLCQKLESMDKPYSEDDLNFIWEALLAMRGFLGQQKYVLGHFEEQLEFCQKNLLDANFPLPIITSFNVSNAAATVLAAAGRKAKQAKRRRKKNSEAKMSLPELLPTEGQESPDLLKKVVDSLELQWSKLIQQLINLLFS